MKPSMKTWYFCVLGLAASSSVIESMDRRAQRIGENAVGTRILFSWVRIKGWIFAT